MNIFKKKLEDSTPKELNFEPIELFQTLFHKEGYSYLRGIQEEVLNSWHQIRDQRDVLCKMNTGSGKTLVSLLMLYSKMVEGVGTSLYLCPDNQLLEQAKTQAELYGIPVCEITKVDGINVFPNEFINSKAILLCTFQRLFNSRSIFQRNNIEVGSIVLDDAHVCLDIARAATTIELPFGHELSDRILKLFKEDLKYQAPGTYHRLIAGDPYAKILKVPYWSWLSRNEELINLIGEFSEDDELFFKWGLIADDLTSYNCFVGPRGIEIAPIHVPYHNVSAFNEAKHRYILSATFEDQIDLIKDLGINKDSIQNALIPKDRKDVGQRLILAPQRFDSRITDEQIMNLAKGYSESGINVMVMAPSWERANKWKDVGATIIDNSSINTEIEKLKNQKGLFYVLVNRYDGVDLNGDMCRILILDGYPSFTSYEQLYSELRLESVKASLKAQIIEQGLGRAVRSGSDYCAVYLMGKDLLQFVGNTSNLKYFTPVTRKQLKLGLSLLDGEPTSNSLKTIKDTANLCLIQDSNWREYHSGILSEAEVEQTNDRIMTNLKIADAESKAMEKYRSRDYQGASNKILNDIVDSFDLTSKQKGWYFEASANYMYLGNIAKSNDLQIKASSTTSHMLQSKNGHNYTKIVANEEQASQVLTFVKNFETSQDFKIYFEDTLDNLQFNPDIPHTKFENSLAEVGRLIGFYAQEPELEFGNGPDVLWGMTDNHYLILEAKSRAIHDEITRDNIGQLLISGEWFKNLYGPIAKHNLVTLQPPNIQGWNVSSSPETRVIDEESLTLLKETLRRFVDGIINSGCFSASNQEVANLLGSHSLTPAGFRTKFLKTVASKKR
ncbi:DEAD/DEAH box helicase [Tenacibaculum maritimum]|uniref:DEAD/DEAH box helicase n=1 Tax=Tenacibaculum maritimum TaxID=107401 RepID=UPI0012E58778|nr:DEAD/DEAH box helicase [Tenacibaculum maritimum]MCD9561649.1 DEAD/DEAH box helicase family protein [Tenacibaculum maritimum]MCD9566635.1 DEAD/DEAH box helicase family protein [Tenacibaculum maritimum]MCD9580201.1 DEAD/DEAH box helicase family protein [Tenacibaculum maritimum]MCD9597360.1 DEAD/DEAH box helicase family protein [Tenacibaculum maritimum]MCD9612307.1 DEAD/DEAH box helicase family protein [Tenacibaculum maritimum]